MKHDVHKGKLAEFAIASENYNADVRVNSFCLLNDPATVRYTVQQEQVELLGLQQLEGIGGVGSGRYCIPHVPQDHFSGAKNHGFIINTKNGRLAHVIPPE